MDSIDLQLVKAARKGNEDAFVQLIEAYQARIYRLGYRMLGNKQEAEDVTQEAFLRVHMNLDRFDGRFKFSTWIYRIAANLCIDHLRKRKGKHALALDANMADAEGEGADLYAYIESNEPSPESEVILSETQLQVRQAIDALPAKYKSVIVLRYLQDLSLQEISDIMDLPLSTVKTRLHRGREYLRQKFVAKKIV